MCTVLGYTEAQVGTQCTPRGGPAPSRCLLAQGPRGGESSGSLRSLPWDLGNEDVGDTEVLWRVLFKGKNVKFAAYL